MQSARALVIACVGVAACRVGEFGELSTPAYGMATTSARCQRELVMDGRGVLYGSERCDGPGTGYRRLRKASRDERERVGTSFAALPPDSTWNPRALPPGDCWEVSHFYYRDDDGGWHRWPNVPRLVSPCALPPPFAEVERAFREARH